LSERPTHGVDGDGDLAMEDGSLGVFFRNSEKAWTVAELQMTGDETEQSFVRRWNNELFYSVFGCGCLLSPSLCSGNGLVHGFVPSWYMT